MSGDLFLIHDKSGFIAPTLEARIFIYDEAGNERGGFGRWARAP